MTGEHSGKPLNAVINMRNSYAEMGQKILVKKGNTLQNLVLYGSCNS